MKDLATLVISEFETQKLVKIDALTGALTRRGFREQAERAVALASRHRHPLSRIAFDLDKFKAVNDVYGHAIGDRVLVETVTRCRERLRRTDILGRLGGEEFAIILPHTDAPGALKVAECIRAALEQKKVGGAISVTASFGCAVLEHPPVPLDELLRRADVALCKAKNGGRNACAAWKSAENSAGGK